MNATVRQPINETVPPTTEEIRQMREAIVSLHADLSATLATVARIMARLDGAEHERPQPPELCPNCHSRINHHLAEAGDLMICSLCGWSAFLGLDGADQVLVPAGAEPGGGGLPRAGWV